MERLKIIIESLIDVRTLLNQNRKPEARTLIMQNIRPKFVEMVSEHHLVEFNDHFNYWCHLIDLCFSQTLPTKCVCSNIETNNSDDNLRPPSTLKKNSLDSFSDDRASLIKETIVRPNSSMNFRQSVVGLQAAKQALMEAVVDPVKYPQWFTNGRKPWRCILLFGPPGTGKSRLAHALAGELQSSIVYRVSSADIVSTWMGQSEKLIRELFNDALNRNQPAIIFVDEIDSLCRARSIKEEESTRRLKTEFLLQMERVRGETSKVFLLGATNCPWEIDSAFLRRFQKRIFIGLPDKLSRIEMLKQMLTTVIIDPQGWSLIGDKTEGLSGSDLAELAQEILYRPLRELRQAKLWRRNADNTYSPLPEAYNNGGASISGFRLHFEEMSKDVVRPRNIEMSDVLHSLVAVRRTVVDEDLLRFRNFTDKFGFTG